MEEVKIRELPEKPSIGTTDYIIVEDDDGTKKTLVRNFRSVVLTSLYFDTISDLKSSSARGLKEGDICETLGYHYPGDGGGALYRITYNPAAVEDGHLVHYLSYSDTLRAEIILGDKINVHQFGAKGDGKTDDTDAIQAALDNSFQRIVEFSNDKLYVTKGSLEIDKHNTVINGNGGCLYPHYVMGINIQPKDDGALYVENVTINNLFFDCSRAVGAIYVNVANKVNIDNCYLYNIGNKGITVNNSSFVNIDRCELIGDNAGSLIVLDGDDNTWALVNTSRFVNVDKCKFSSFSKAVHVITTGNNGTGVDILANLTNCEYDSNVNNSCCIYIASPIETITVESNSVKAADEFLYTGAASEGNVSCRNISCINTKRVFNINGKQSILNLSGVINVESNAVIFENLDGKVNSNIAWDLMPNGASFSNPPEGELFDTVQPFQYNAVAKGYSISGSTLTLREIRNMHVDWNSSTNNLTEIKNGVKGQLIYIKSSTNKSIIENVPKILLTDDSIQLGSYKGITLKCDGTKWVQIQ